MKTQHDKLLDACFNLGVGAGILGASAVWIIGICIFVMLTYEPIQ